MNYRNFYMLHDNEVAQIAVCKCFTLVRDSELDLLWTSILIKKVFAHYAREQFKISPPILQFANLWMCQPATVVTQYTNHAIGGY